MRDAGGKTWMLAGVTVYQGVPSGFRWKLDDVTYYFGPDGWLYEEDGETAIRVALLGTWQAGVGFTLGLHEACGLAQRTVVFTHILEMKNPSIPRPETNRGKAGTEGGAGLTEEV